jgi:uncharacterized protein
MSAVAGEMVAMLAGMNPVLVGGEFIFCTTDNAGLAARAMANALGFLRGKEGISLILERSDAAALGFCSTMPIRRIVLEAYLALDGVCPTATVSSALSSHAIPCNLVAAYHHDNIFVATGMAGAALGILRAVQAEFASGV